MRRLTLYADDGKPVVQVLTAPMSRMPEALLWGCRTFMRRPDGRYYEGLLLPVFTADEWRRMKLDAAATATAAQAAQCVLAAEAAADEPPAAGWPIGGITDAGGIADGDADDSEAVP